MILIDTTEVPATFATIYIELGGSDEPPEPERGKAVTAGDGGLTLASARSIHHPRIVVVHVDDSFQPVPSPWNSTEPVLRTVQPAIGPSIRVRDPEFAHEVKVPWPGGGGPVDVTVHRVGDLEILELDDLEIEQAYGIEQWLIRLSAVEH